MTAGNALAKERALNFFALYAKSFDERDWPTFVSLYHVPAMSVRADGSVKFMQSRDEIDQFFRGVSDAWAQEGYDHFDVSDFDVRALGGNSMLVSFNWHMMNRAGTMLKQWHQSYQLVRAGAEWRVLNSTFHAPSLQKP